MRRLAGILAASLVSTALILSLLLVVSPSLDRARAAYTSHLPILIEGDDQFLLENGVTGGSGVEGDPYVIEDWDIACGDSDGIAVVNTTAHFVIRNVYVHDTTVHMPPVVGILLWNVTNGSISHSIVANHTQAAVFLSSANMTSLDNNTITMSYEGILSYYSSHDSICDNIVRNCTYGIYFLYSENNSAERNSVENSTSDGIRLEDSANNHVVENIALRNTYGIRLNDSYLNEIRANEVHGGYDQGIDAPIELQHSENNIVSSNDASGYQHGITLSYSESNTISGNTVSGTTGSGGVQLDYSSGNSVDFNNLIDCWTGVGLYASGDNEVSSNNISLPAYGIRALLSLNNNFTGNHISQAVYNGIILERSGSSNVTLNEVKNGNADGILLFSSSQVNLSGNVISDNLGNGLAIYLSERLEITANQFTNDGIYIEDSGTLLEAPIAVYNSHTITPDNTVDSGPILYYKNESGLTLDEIDVGQLILANCSHVNISGLDLAAADAGLIVGYCEWVNISGSEFSFNDKYGVMARATHNLTISGCTAFSNYVAADLIGCRDANVSGCNIVGNAFGGLSLFRCDWSSVLSNRIVNNSEWGLGMGQSNASLIWGNKIAGNLIGLFYMECPNGTVYHNDFSNPTQVSEWGLGMLPRYNYTYPTGGNFWSDYSGSDNMNGPAQDVPGADGVGDTLYVVYSDSKDFYPLMQETWAPDSPPVAILSGFPLTGDTATVFSFNASGSHDAEDPSTLLSYRWDWENDGVWDTPFGSENVLYHQFPASGTYTVRVEVSDMAGGYGNTTFTVEVTEVIPEYDGVLLPILGIVVLVAVINAGRRGRAERQ